MQFGGKADEDASRAMFVDCRERGITMFDTAHVYTDGASETLLGRFVGADRDRLIVASKVNFRRGNSAASIAESCEESRARLGLDTIDLYYLHRFDPEVPLEESFEALATLQRKGHIRYIGASNFAAWQVMKAQAVAEKAGTRIDAIQPMLNLVKRQAESELLPMAQDQQIAVFPYSPLGGGLLTGKYRAGAEGRLTESTMYSRRYGEDWMHSAAGNLATLANELGIDAATLAVAWAMRRPGVTAPIISARNIDQLGPSLAALEAEIDEGLLARIGALSRPPAPATDRTDEVA